MFKVKQASFMIALSLVLGAVVTASVNAIESIGRDDRVSQGVDRGSDRPPLPRCPETGPKIACTTMGRIVAISGKSPDVNGYRAPKTTPVNDKKTKATEKKVKLPTSSNPGPRTLPPSFPKPPGRETNGPERVFTTPTRGSGTR